MLKISVETRRKVSCASSGVGLIAPFIVRSSMNNYYILCTANREAARLALTRRYGSHVVQINDPMELLNRIEIAWQRQPLASGRCVIAPVAYDKGSLLDPTPGLLPPPEYSYSQKPKWFEEDREFRYVLTCAADVIKLRALAGEGLAPEDHLTLSLPDCGDICSLT